MKPEDRQETCIKLTYKSPEGDGRVVILLGRVLKEDDSFLTFQTGRKEYTISKSLILSMEPTDEIFRRGVET